MSTKPKITVATEGNVLICEYHGHITVADMKAQSKAIAAIASKVGPNFTVLVDMTALDVVDRDCIPLVGGIMEQLNSLGASRVVRVIPDPRKDIGLGILSLFHYKRGIAFNTVPTRAEADRLVQ